MRINDLDMITFRKNAVKPKISESRKYDIIGFDTETYKGKVTIIADSNGGYLIPHNPDNLLRFLTQNKYRNKINFFFNLEYDMNAIIKTLKLNEIKELIFYNETILYRDNIIYKVKIVPKKCFSIGIMYLCKSGKFAVKDIVKYFDISKFYQYGSLEKTYNKSFACMKHKCRKDKSFLCKDCKEYKESKTPKNFYIKLLNAEKGFHIDTVDKYVIQYCIEDSLACQKLAKAFTEMVGEFVDLKDYYSPASIAKAFIRKYLPYDYRFKPSLIQNMALKSYAGGRFEVIRKGYIDKCYMVDINSAYPHVMNELYETNGEIRQNKYYEDDSLYSFFYIDVKIEDCFISPLKFFLEKKNLLIYPEGKFNNIFINKKEYEMIEQLGFNMTIHSAMHIFNEEPRKPFGWINQVYQLRKKLKNPNDYDRKELILKLAMNSGYGCTIQTTISHDRVDTDELEGVDPNLIDEIPYCNSCRYEFLQEKDIGNICKYCGGEIYLSFRLKKYYAGQFYNPIYASTITGNTRIKLYNDSIGKNKNLEKHVIMYATDSITFDKKVSHLKIDNELGNYDITDKFHALILGSGVYTLYNDEGEKKFAKTRARGFGNFDLSEIAKNNLYKDKYTFKNIRPYKLKESKKDIDKINIFEEHTKDLVLNFDKKREWEYDIKNFKELLENEIFSKPWTI